MIWVDLAIKSLLVSALGWLTVAQLRKSSASTRHLALVLTMAGICVLPFIITWLPVWHVPFISVKEPVYQSVAATEITSVQSPGSPSVDPLTVILIVWASVAAFLSLKVVFRLIRLSRLEHQLQMTVNPSLQALVANLCRRSAKHVLLLEGPTGESPMVWGHSRPVLLIPSHAGEWPEDRLNSVVLHELAHVERKDWTASVFANFVCAVHWFNPIVWILKKRMDVESEVAADDHVLSKGVPATNYASHLVDVGRELCREIPSTQAAVAMARPGTLDLRVHAILEERRCRRGIRGSVSIGLMVMVAGLVGVIGAAKPTLIRQVLNAAKPIESKVEAKPSHTTSIKVTSNSKVNKAVIKAPESPPIERHVAARTAVARHPTPRQPETSSVAPASLRPKATKQPQILVGGGGSTVLRGPSGSVITHSGDDEPDSVEEHPSDDEKDQIEDASKQVKKATDDASKEVAQALKDAEESARKSGVNLHFGKDFLKIPMEVVTAINKKMAIQKQIKVEKKKDKNPPPPPKKS